MYYAQGGRFLRGWANELPGAIFTMTPSNGNIFRVTGPLCGEFTGDRWIPLTKASDAELWCFFDLRLNKRLIKQSTPVIWDAIALIITYLLLVNSFGPSSAGEATPNGMGT